MKRLLTSTWDRMRAFREMCEDVAIQKLNYFENSLRLSEALTIDMKHAPIRGKQPESSRQKSGCSGKDNYQINGQGLQETTIALAHEQAT